MILLNEAHCIANTLASAAPYVDQYCILDTGSTDGTQEIVREVMDQHHVPGTVHQGPFTDYSDTRNRCAKLAGNSEPFILWMDADDILEGGDSLRFLLTISKGTCFQLEQKWPDRDSLWVPRVVRADSGWQYKGHVHEILTHEHERMNNLVGPRLRHYPSAIGAARSQARWPKDVLLLNKMLIEDPQNTRAREHLDQTLAALTQLE
jgi:glycosyltransferase involved in cell wall biosynthesis